MIELHGMYLSPVVYTSSNVPKPHSIYTYAPIETTHIMVNELIVIITFDTLSLKFQ